MVAVSLRQHALIARHVTRHINASRACMTVAEAGRRSEGISGVTTISSACTVLDRGFPGHGRHAAQPRWIYPRLVEVAAAGHRRRPSGSATWAATELRRPAMRNYWAVWITVHRLSISVQVVHLVLNVDRDVSTLARWWNHAVWNAPIYLRIRAYRRSRQFGPSVLGSVTRSVRTHGSTREAARS